MGARMGNFLPNLRFAISELVLLFPAMRRFLHPSFCIIAAAVLAAAVASAADADRSEERPRIPTPAGSQVSVGIGAGVDILNVVEDEATRRQETTGLLKRTLARAEGSRKQKNFWAATVLYEATLAYSRELGGVNVESETKRAFAGLTEARLGLAKAAAKQRDFNAADRHVALLLELDPKSKKGLEYRDYNRAVAEAHVGRMPSIAIRQQAAGHLAQKKEVDTMVQDGKFLYEMRLLNEAKSKLKQAIHQDPSNRAAYYYLSLIQEAQYGDEARKRDLMQKERLVEVERAWNEFLK